jgi:peptidoglycan biosynthesis protein MviN/MurJ (putative lipid II flippase)
MFQLDRVVIEGPGLGGLEADLPAALTPLPESVRSRTGALRLGAAGLAFASATAAWLELVLLQRRLRALVGPFRAGGGQLVPILFSAGAAALVAAALRLLVVDLHPLLGLPIAGLPTAAAYLLVAHRLGVAEASDLAKIVRRRH